MVGLSVRWSLVGAEPQVAQKLRDYVVSASLERFSGMPGLAFKTWRLREGEWFEGTYVFAGAAEREAFQAAFTAQAPSTPVSQIVGAAPVLIESFEVIAVAEGGEGFVPGAAGAVLADDEDEDE